MTSKWIEHLILVDKLSYEEIGRRYGCSGTNIKNVARRLGIELPVKRKINSKGARWSMCYMWYEAYLEW